MVATKRYWGRGWGGALALLALAAPGAQPPVSAAVEHRETTVHAAPWEAGKRVVIRHALGSVRLRAGADGEVSVRAERRLEGPDRQAIEAFLRGLKVNVSALDDCVEVSTIRPREPQKRLDQATVNLDVTVPARAPVEVDSSFGDLDAEGLAALQATTTFGGLTVRAIAGDVTLEGKHGKVVVDDVRGDVHITHSLGDVAVARVGGALVARNQFAQIHAAEVGGRAVIDNRSGPIVLSRVGGGAQVTCQYAQVQVSDVVGDLKVNNRAENVAVSDVRGVVTVTNANGSVEARDITGELRVDNRQGAVTIAGVAGKVTVAQGDGELKVRDVRGSADLTNTHGLVEVDGITEACRIRNDFGPVTVQNAHGNLNVTNAWGLVRVDVPPGEAREERAEWQLENTHGNVVLGIPPGAGCRLDIEVSAGTIDSQLAAVAGQRAGNRETAQAVINGGGIAIEVRVDLGMAQIQKRAAPAEGPARK
jgi:DUF4097 and DUF4098 domain-containing protein YvlB